MILTDISKKIDFLAGNKKNICTNPIMPFDKSVCSFLNHLSQRLIKGNAAKSFSDIITFAFWCRKSNIEYYKKNFFDKRTRFGRGLIFHIAPSNVPINFAYSFVFGLLSGNANIVRASSKHFPQVDIVTDAINHLFSLKNYNFLSLKNKIIKYDHDLEITNKISSICNARIIWGGDETIKNIRKSPIPEQSFEICFADKYSFCIVNSNSLTKINDAEFTKLVNNFYNDTYLVDQNACSSPHMIIWYGRKNKKIIEKFWQKLHLLVAKKYDLPHKASIDKFTLLSENLIDHKDLFKITKHENYIYRLKLKKLPNNIDNLRGLWGLFYEYESMNLNEISTVVNKKFQTLVYYGFKKNNLVNFVIKNNLAGIDRIVPIGKALDMSDVWDGHEIIKSLTRVIEV